MPSDLNDLRKATKDNPLRILMSACLGGICCGFDGTTYGNHTNTLQLFSYDTASVVRFCPEDYSFGTPREICDIYGGTGFDVLDGKAKVLTSSGKDWTLEMIKASEKMLRLAISEKIELAILMDISAACGSTVIYDGHRFSENKLYQKGAGVCAAQLIRNNIKVISQRDFASFEILFSKLDPLYKIDKTKKDHLNSDWYMEYFKGTTNNLS